MLFVDGTTSKPYLSFGFSQSASGGSVTLNNNNVGYTYAGYPALLWLVDRPTLPGLMAVELWLAFLYAAYNGAMAVYLTEIMPAEIRTSGFSLAYSLATAIFGGFTPAICTYLIHVTGNRAMPGAWMSIAAVVGMAGALGLGGSQ